MSKYDTKFLRLGLIVCRRLCQSGPIDVVYTWVNGSDPLFLDDLEQSMVDIQEASVYNDTTPSRFRDKEVSE